MKSRMVAVLLALTLGIFGVHLFYLNRPAKGFVYLLFCFTGIPMVLGWLAAFRLLFMTDKTFIKKYVINSGQ